MANDIKYLKSTDAVSSSVDIINSNFKSLKDAISAGNINISKYDQEIQELITNLKENFSNVTDAIYNTLDINEEKWTKTVKELETTATALNGEIARATLQLESKVTEELIQASTKLEAKILGEDSDTEIYAGLTQMVTDKIGEYQESVTELVNSVRYDDTEIKANLSQVATNANNAKSSVTTLENKVIADKAELTAQIQSKASQTEVDGITTRLAVVEAKAEIDGSDFDIESALELYAKKDEVGELAEAQLSSSINDSINAAVSTCATKDELSDVQSVQAIMQGTIDGHSASISSCVTKDSDGYISSNIKLNADQIDFVGKEINFTGTGTFSGDVNAQSFTVLNSSGYDALKFKIWSSSDASSYGSADITVGTPVFIATTYNTDGSVNKRYVVDMTELNAGDNGGYAAYESTRIQSGNSYNPTILCSVSTTYSTTIMYCKSDGKYRIGSTSGNLANGKYLKRISREPMIIKIFGSGSSLVDNSETCLAYCSDCFRIMEITFSNGDLVETINYYCIPYINSYIDTNATDYNGNSITKYQVTYSTSHYYFVNEIQTISTSKYKICYLTVPSNSGDLVQMPQTSLTYSQLQDYLYDVETSLSGVCEISDTIQIVTGICTSESTTSPISFDYDYSDGANDAA